MRSRRARTASLAAVIGLGALGVFGVAAAPVYAQTSPPTSAPANTGGQTGGGNGAGGETTAPTTKPKTTAKECIDKLEHGGKIDDCEKAPSPILPAANELIWGGLSFIILFILLSRVGYPAIKKGMDNRAEKIRTSIDEAEQARGDAQRILEVARAEGSLEKVENELFQFSQVFEGNEQLREKLTDQSLPVEKRQAIVEDLLDQKASPLTVNFISFLVGAGRARELPEIVNRLVERAAAERQREVAEVRTAIMLDDEQRRRLTEALEKATGKQIELKVIQDPSVLGGVVARVGDTVIDGTVRRRLDQLRESL